MATLAAVLQRLDARLEKSENAMSGQDIVKCKGLLGLPSLTRVVLVLALDHMRSYKTMRRLSLVESSSSLFIYSVNVIG